MRLLLDAHLAPALAYQLRRHGVEAIALQDWREGAYREATDEHIQEAAGVEGWVLVTYDLRTIRPLAKQWAEAGRLHAGIIFVDEKTISPNDIGRLLRALLALNAQHGDEPWQGQTVFLHAQ